MKETALLIFGVTLILIGTVGVIAVGSSYYSGKLFLNEFYVNMENILSIAKQTANDAGATVTEMITYFQVVAENAELLSILYPQLGNTSASIRSLISSMENLSGNINLSSDRIESMNNLVLGQVQKTMLIIDISFSFLAILVALFIIIGISILLIRKRMLRITLAI